MIQSWTEIVIYVFIFVLIIFTTKIIVFKKEEVKEINESDQRPIVVVNPGKALAQNVKFVMRLKKRMKEFKARKIKESLDHS